MQQSADTSQEVVDEYVSDYEVGQDNVQPLGLVGLDESGRRELAMAATIFHWAIHPWAVYGIVGLSLAFFCYNKGLPLIVRSAMYPIFGERVWDGPDT